MQWLAVELPMLVLPKLLMPRGPRWQGALAEEMEVLAAEAGLLARLLGLLRVNFVAGA